MVNQQVKFVSASEFQLSEILICNKTRTNLQWATKVLRHFVILEYLRQISFLISTILPPPPFSMLDFLSLEFASFLYNIEKGVGGWLSK